MSRGREANPPMGGAICTPSRTALRYHAEAAVRFTIKCLVVHHVSGRVTLTPLDFPHLAVHAVDLRHARDELALALDDKISRAHPRRVLDYLRSSSGEPLTVQVPLIKVWGGEADELRPISLLGLRAPGHADFVDVRMPRLGLRFWAKEGKSSPSLTSVALDSVKSHTGGHDEDDLLALRSEQEESFLDLTVDARPLRLSDLKPRELDLDERPLFQSEVESGEDEPESAADDDWDDARKGRKRKPTSKRRPATPTLSRLGAPLDTLAREGALDQAFERDALVDELLARCRAEEPEAIVLVGPSGVGKTAILHELCRRVVKDQGVERGVPIFLVDGGRLIAGEGMWGDWQAQVLSVVREARAAKAILCVNRVVDLLEAGKSAHSDQNVAQLLAPVLAAREVCMLAEATPDEWTRVEQRNAGFARLFSVIRVEEPATDVTRRILERTARALAARHELAIAPDVVDEVCSLCMRFLPYGVLVGNAVALLRRLVDAGAHAHAQGLRRSDVLTAFSGESGIPEKLLRDDVPLDPADTRAFLAARVKGQAAAVERVAGVVSVIKANLGDRRRPAAVLLFAGPTGVGKTELCKALAELVFGVQDRLVRLDMGEYGGPDALARLLGEDRSPGTLTASVRRQPFCVVLLDEIEKAHPAVFDALLGVLGEGRLTDAGGRLTDFRNAIVILTSNIGAETLRAAPGFGDGGSGDVVAHYRAEVRRFFRPELYNRLDDVVVFSPLGPAEIAEIVERELWQVAGREGLRRHEIDLAVDPSARARLVEKGIDPRYGARPLKRAIERELVVPVAAYLAGHDTTGATRLSVAAGQGGLALSAESLTADAGPSRAMVSRWLERAADLRAECRTWQRCEPMAQIRRDVALFDRESRHPLFWADRAIAEQRARHVATGRELQQAFADLVGQAEAAEDLAYEAYLTRQGGAASALEVELELISNRRAGLGERLFTSLYPGSGSEITLTLLPARGALAQAMWLIGAYLAWARRRGGEVQLCVALPVEKGASSGKHPRVEVRWREAKSAQSVESAAVAIALVARDLPGSALLAAEHGLHRFTVGGNTSVVRVQVEHQRRRLPGDLFDPAAWEKQAPMVEIRRVSVEKKQARDLRTEAVYGLVDGNLDLEPVVQDFLAFRVLGRRAPGRRP
jgi:ATP-dependent Clp protease ATP-binding subunit ClpC